MTNAWKAAARHWWEKANELRELHDNTGFDAGDSEEADEGECWNCYFMHKQEGNLRNEIRALRTKVSALENSILRLCGDKEIDGETLDYLRKKVDKEREAFAFYARKVEMLRFQANGICVEPDGDARQILRGGE